MTDALAARLGAAPERAVDPAVVQFARELGEEGLEEFLETKHVHWDFSQEKKP